MYAYFENGFLKSTLLSKRIIMENFWLIFSSDKHKLGKICGDKEKINFIIVTFFFLFQ